MVGDFLVITAAVTVADLLAAVLQPKLRKLLGQKKIGRPRKPRVQAPAPVNPFVPAP
jgi:hypothetical protein